MKKIYILIIITVLFNLRSISQNCALLCNGNFDNPAMTTTSGLTVTLNCWNTTASDGKMEVWGNGYNGVNSYSGIQFVELNATQAAIMYQDFTVSTNGTNLTASFAHRARTNPGMTDSVEVSMGPVGGPYTSLGRFGDGPSAWGYYTTVGFTAATAGTYRVRFNPFYYSLGNSGIGNFLDDVTVCATQQAGVHEFTNESIASVYPNPSNSTVTFKFNNPWKVDFALYVYDHQGRLVRSVNGINGEELNIERGDLNAGIYFYELSSSKGNAKGKIAFTD